MKLNNSACRLKALIGCKGLERGSAMLPYLARYGLLHAYQLYQVKDMEQKVRCLSFDKLWTWLLEKYDGHSSVLLLDDGQRASAGMILYNAIHG
jgi:hypothetical protein